MERDRLGRRRRPGQDRGLRPLYPSLPDEWVSKVLRVAMSEADWARFEALAAGAAATAATQARANGLVVSRLLEVADQTQTEPDPPNWLDWERRKVLRLLPGSRSPRPFWS